MSTPAPQSAPPSMIAPAQNISPADLQRELSNAIRPPEPVKAPEVKDVPREEPQRPANVERPPSFKDALRKQVMEEPKKEEKVEPKKEDVKVLKEEVPAKDEPKKEEVKREEVKAAKDESIPEEQLRVLPHDKPDTAKRIKQILSLKAEAEKREAAAKAEIEALKKQAPTQANAEELARLKEEHAKLADEATRLRRRYAWEADPEVKSRYVEPIKAAEDSIASTLKRAGYSDATLKIIADEGGMAEFSRSRRLYPVSVRDPDDPSQTKTEYRTGAEIAHAYLAALPVADAEEIKASLGRQQLIRAEEKAARQQAEENAKQYFESQTASQRQAAEQAEQMKKQAEKEYSDWLAETEGKTEFLKDKTVPDNASAEERKRIEEYNTFNKQLRDGLRKHPTNAKEYAALKLEAAESHHLRRERASMQAEIDRLTSALAKARSSLKTTPTGGSLMAKTAPAAPRPDKNADPTDFRSGLRKAMQAATGNIDEE